MLRKPPANPTRPARVSVPEHTGYLQNQSLFSEFYAVQKEFVARLAQQPQLLRIWLDSLPQRDDSNEGPPNASKAWRTSRLSATRQRELSALLSTAELGPTTLEPLTAFLLRSLPVSIYLLIADRAQPSLRALDPLAADFYRKLIDQRDHLFHVNYGFVRAAVAGRKPYDELLSAASCGLVDAIDRYVPDGKKSARFAYFASFWVRYQVSRYGQKNGGAVTLSINQQRIVRRIERYLEERRRDGLPEPSEAELCTDLKISPEAYYWYQQRPVMVSLDSISSAENEHGDATLETENLIASSEPNPTEQLEESEIAEYLREILRKCLPGRRRVMLSYARKIGNLADAVEDYLSELGDETVKNTRRLSATDRRRALLAFSENEMNVQPLDMR
jgi:DNA-directed RNA polymerase specialized sigma subunit